MVENMNELVTDFEKVGVAFTETCNRYNGKTQMYLKLLNKFSSTIVPRISDLSSYYEDSDFDFLLNEIHAIKGVTLNLGMNKLGRLCSELEANLKECPETISSRDFQNIESMAFQIEVVIHRYLE